VITHHLKTRFLENKPERDKRCDIQHDDPDFIDGHATVVERVKGFSREIEPSAMEAVHPVVAKAEHAKPNQEYRIVEGETVKQKLFDGIGIHDGTSYS
jgi:hypothetical protein